MIFVGQDSSDEIHDSTPEAYWNDEILCLKHREVEAVAKDDGQKSPKTYNVSAVFLLSLIVRLTVKDGDESHLCGSVNPSRDIFRCGLDVMLCVVAASARILLHGFGSSTHDRLVAVVEEVGRGVVFGY